MGDINTAQNTVILVLIISVFSFLISTGLSFSQTEIGAENIEYPENVLDHWNLENDYVVSEGDNIEGFVEENAVILVKENYSSDNEKFPITIDSENVTIISESGPDSVEIDGGGVENVFNLRNGGQFSLIGVTVTGGSDQLVSVDGSSDNTRFFHNYFSGSSSSDSISSRSDGLFVENNIFSGGDSGIVTTGSDFELERNTFKDQGSIGVRVVSDNENVENVRIDLNEFSQIEKKLIIFEVENFDLKDILVENNHFLGSFAISVSDSVGSGNLTENILAYRNWWGTKYRVEIENKVSDNVNFENWYDNDISENGSIVTDYFRVDNISSSNEIVENENLEIGAKVSEVGSVADGDNLKLYDLDWTNDVQDSVEVSSSGDVTLEWSTEMGDGGSGKVKVQSKYDYSTVTVDIGKVTYFDIEKESDLYWHEEEGRMVCPVRVSNLGSKGDEQVVRLFRESDEDDKKYWLDSKKVTLSGEENKVVDLSWDPYEEKDVENIVVASDNDDFGVNFGESLNLLKDNFYMMDNYSRQLNGEFEESVEVKSWNWVIYDIEYSENDVIGNTYLYRDTEDNLVINAPFIKNDNIESGTVKIRVLAVVEKEGRRYYHYDRVSVEVINKVRANTRGPYEVPEENKIKLNGKKSSGPIDYYNWGLEDFEEGMYLVNDNSPEPTFYSPSVSENKEVGVRLEITKGTHAPVKGYYYDEATTKIKIFDTSLEAIIGTEEIDSGMVENLKSDSEGRISEFKWKILNDPTGTAELIGENLRNPTFYAPGNLENDVEVEVSLKVSNRWKSDNTKKSILIKTVEPSAPENLWIDNEESPQYLKNLSPTISAIYKHKNPTSIGESIEVVIIENGNDRKWEIEKEIDISQNERGYLKSQETLTPSTSYGVKVRFQDSSGWGDWAKDNFRTDGFLSLDEDEAARFLVSGASLKKKARTVEKALDEDLDSTMQVMKRVSTNNLAPLLSEMALSPYSPRHAAMILEESLLDRSVQIVKRMIEAENFEALDDIFYSSELSKERLIQITDRLSEEELNKLEDELSGPTKRRIPGLSAGSSYYLTIILFVVAIIALIGSLFVIGYILITRTRRRIWNNLIKDFLSGDIDKAAISSNLSPEKEAERARAAIDRLELEEEMDLAKKDSKIILLKK